MDVIKFLRDASSDFIHFPFELIETLDHLVQAVEGVERMLHVLSEQVGQSHREMMGVMGSLLAEVKGLREPVDKRMTDPKDLSGGKQEARAFSKPIFANRTDKPSTVQGRFKKKGKK